MQLELFRIKAILNTGLEDQHLLAQTGGESKTGYFIKKYALLMI